MGLTYKKSGVDIREGERFVDLIKPLARKTFRPEVMTDIGSFSGLFRLGKYKEPVLVSGTDGVGTKLKMAFIADRHDTVGIDLVAMCVNDILTCGAEPLFFLDYMAVGKLRAEKAALVIEGIVEGCKDAGCALIGGETAEMPGFYAEDEYDLAGFAVGAVGKNEIIDGREIRPGDVLVGLASNGLHSNGYSLVRKIFFETKKIDIRSRMPELGKTLGEELLRPTRIYVKAVDALRGKVRIKGMAHITGGGLPGNLPRVFPPGVSAQVKRGAWPEPPIFGLLRDRGNLPEEEMRFTFNMGIGYIIVAPRGEGDTVVSILGQRGYDAFVIGSIVEGGEGVRYV